MKHLNYSHLLYFWTVAREGSIAKASKILHLTPQTISGQLKLLEDAVGHPLFERVGRGLVLSSTGQIVNQYADEIFTLGAELAQRVREPDVAASGNLRVGVVNSIAKLITYRVLKPLLAEHSDVKLICHEANLESLLGELAVHQLDLVVSDRKVPPGLNVRAYHHHLGDSALAVFAPEAQATRYEEGFPNSLEAASMLMPAQASPLRRSLDEWFDERDIAPR
ncbi:MAG: LysR family transcriptional regulator, partial [Pseudomonadales bacterium]